VLKDHVDASRRSIWRTSGWRPAVGNSCLGLPAPGLCKPPAERSCQGVRAAGPAPAPGEIRTPATAPRNSAGSAFGRTARAREESVHLVPAGGDQNRVMAFSTTRQACKPKARLTVCETSWPLPIVRCPPAVLCLHCWPAAALCSHFLLAAAAPLAWPPPRTRWNASLNSGNSGSLSGLLSEGPASIQASWWSVMTPCASASPMPVAGQSGQGASGMCRSTVSDLKVQWQPRAKGPHLYRHWKPNTHWP